MSTLPKLDGVRESTLKEFLRLTAGNHTITDKNPLPKILDTEGRCIRVSPTGFALDWHSLSESLLGACRPCEEFRIEGNCINARLKTSAQIEADGLACDIDEMYEVRTSKIQTWWPFFDSKPVDEPRNARQIGQARRERKPLSGAAADVMRVMNTRYRIGTVARTDLVDFVKTGMAPRPDAEGKDRRAKYIRAGIDKLVTDGLLHMHANDHIGLSSLIMEDDNVDEEVNA